MNTTLTVDDPLADREVSIVITLTASPQPRDKRPVLVSVGVAEQMPVIKSGVFGAAMDLVEEAWLAFGVQTQMAMQAAHLTEDTAVPAEIVAETPVAEADATETAVAAKPQTTPSTPPRPAAPQPSAANLSLF